MTHQTTSGHDGLHHDEPMIAVAPGDSVVARDGRVGRVVRILRTENGAPRHVIVAVGRLLRHYPVVPCALITSVDGARRTIRVRGDRRSIRSLSEALPIVL
jgi:signal peptidase I